MRPQLLHRFAVPESRRGDGSPPFEKRPIRQRLDFGRYQGMVAAVGTVIVVVLLSLLWIWQSGQERRGLLEMPAVERAALYRETRQNTDVLCREAAIQPWLDGRCRSAAEFLLSFPECDADCTAFARAHTSQPAR